MLMQPMQEFVMGTGLIPSDGEVWRVRRRAIVPALHKKWVHGCMGAWAHMAHGFEGGQAMCSSDPTIQGC